MSVKEGPPGVPPAAGRGRTGVLRPWAGGLVAATRKVGHPAAAGSPHAAVPATGTDARGLEGCGRSGRGCSSACAHGTPERSLWCGIQRCTPGDVRANHPLRRTTAPRRRGSRSRDRAQRSRTTSTLAPRAGTARARRGPPVGHAAERRRSTLRPASRAPARSGRRRRPTAARPAGAQLLDQLGRAGHGGRAVGLVQQVPGRRPAAATGRPVSASAEQRGPAGVRGRVGVRHLRRQQPRAPAWWTSAPTGTRTTGARSGCTSRRVHPQRRRRRARPASSRRAGRPRRCRGGPRARRPARGPRRRRAASSPSATRAARREDAGDDGRRRRAQPARLRHGVARRPPAARAGWPPSRSKAARIAWSTRCSLAARQRLGALALDVEVEAAAEQLGPRPRRTGPGTARRCRRPGRGWRWSPATRTRTATGHGRSAAQAEAERRGGGVGARRDRRAAWAHRRWPTPGP